MKRPAALATALPSTAAPFSKLTVLPGAAVPDRLGVATSVISLPVLSVGLGTGPTAMLTDPAAVLPTGSVTV